MPLIRWTRRALDDLASAEMWLDRERSSEIAVRTLGRIRAKARQLQHVPSIGRPDGADRRLLRVTGTAYLISYRIIGNDAVEVLRVLHERQSRPALP